MAPETGPAQSGPQWAEHAHRRLNALADGIGDLLVTAFHYLALFAIGGAIVWSAVASFLGMVAKGQASIDDILLLFIYLELGAMVGIYFKTTHMPVRFLIYVAMTAMTRLLIGDASVHHRPYVEVVGISAAILLLALATLVVRYGSAKYPSGGSDGRS